MTEDAADTDEYEDEDEGDGDGSDDGGIEQAGSSAAFLIAPAAGRNISTKTNTTVATASGTSTLMTRSNIPARRLAAVRSQRMACPQRRRRSLLRRSSGVAN